MQIYRLFEIVYILLDKKSVTAKELASEFGVSTRTIYRDIDTLSLSGIPVYTEKGKGGGISLLSDFVLNKSILSEQEQNEILIALQGLSTIKTGNTNKVLSKVSSIFNKNVIDWLEVDFSGWGDEKYFFNDFKTAILERRVVEFDYYNSSGEKAFRRVEPMKLWFKFKAWYFEGFCLNKQDTRLFKLSRIKNLTVTSEHFPEQEGITLSDNLTWKSWDIYEFQEDITLKFQIAPEMIYRVFDELNECTIEKQSDESIVVKVICPEGNWLYNFLLSFGEYIEVLEPEHIRKTIKDRIDKVSKKYL